MANGQEWFERILSSRITFVTFLFLLLFDGFDNVRLAPDVLEDLSIYDIQYTLDPSGDSPYVGQEVVLTGIVTGSFYDGYTIAEASGPWHAIFVYSQKNGPDIGDEVEVTGTVKEYNGWTEIGDVIDFQFLSSENHINPVTLHTDTAAQEMYEAVLIRVANVTVTSLENYGEWVVSDSRADIRCDDINDYMYFPELGDIIDSLTGVLFYSYGDYKIEPRGTSDIMGNVIPHYALQGHIVTMNDHREIVLDAYLEIHGDRIVGIHSGQPPGVQIIRTEGLIYPGLIDAHNHPPYNALDVIPFGKVFRERYEWQNEPLYANFKDQFFDILNYGWDNAQRVNLFKLAEVRSISAGTTMIQGFNANGHQYDGFARQGMIINNAERFPSRVYSQVFPLQQAPSFWQEKEGEYWERFMIHLSEGTTPAALREFYAWEDMGMLDSRTTIIHGIPYGSAEWSLMAAANASLVWSPESNLRLYGTTANIPEARAAGMNVALAPDWTESGTLNMLSELKIANYVNQSHWEGTITSLQFAEFVTRNAALALGVEDRAGQIQIGFVADIMVLPGDAQDPYGALLEAEPADVKLTIVNGRPMYGTPMLMEQFPFLSQLEEIDVGGVRKQLAITIESHAIPGSDKPFYEILSELEAAYEASDPKVCAFLGIERDLSARIFLPYIVRTEQLLSIPR